MIVVNGESNGIEFLQRRDGQRGELVRGERGEEGR